MEGSRAGRPARRRLPGAESFALPLDRGLGHGVEERRILAGGLAHANFRRRAPTPSAFAADGVIIGSPDLGPLAGGGTRAIALANTEQFLRQARLATREGEA